MRLDRLDCFDTKEEAKSLTLAQSFCLAPERTAFRLPKVRNFDNVCVRVREFARWPRVWCWNLSESIPRESPWTTTVTVCSPKCWKLLRRQPWALLAANTNPPYQHWCLHSTDINPAPGMLSRPFRGHGMSKTYCWGNWSNAVQAALEAIAFCRSRKGHLKSAMTVAEWDGHMCTRDWCWFHLQTCPWKIYMFGINTRSGLKLRAGP